MKYVVILLIGILLGGGAAIFFLGASPAKSAPGQAVRPPDQGGAPPATIVISLEQSFIALGAPLTILALDDERARDLYGYDLLLLRPDLHVVWRGNRLPDDAAKLAAIATGH